MENDPWLSRTDNGLAENQKCEFEDNFLEKISKLPDSEEYVAGLERKLKKIKQTGGCSRQDQQNLINSLEDKRDSCMYRLIAGDKCTNSNEDIDLDAPAFVNSTTGWLMSHVNPEQPLTVGELVELVKADYLANHNIETEEEPVEKQPTCKNRTHKMANPNPPRLFWGKKTFCIVTGASQGIGRSFAIEFSNHFGNGSVIVLMARSFSGLESTASLIKTANSNIKVKVHIVDLSVPNAARFREIITDAAGDPNQFELSLLVHNAGSLGKISQLASEMDDTNEWDRYLSLNLYSVTMLTAEFLKVFKTGHRALLNVTSLCALQPFKGMGYYCIGKASREMYFRLLAEEDPSLDVLSYSPGPVNTGMINDVIESVRSGETKALFENMRNSGTLVSLDETTARVINVLRLGKYKSGGRVDYFEPL